MVDRLYLYTDGIEEARNEDDEMFSSERLHRLFSGDAELIFENIVTANAEYLENSDQDDDITLVEIHYSEQQPESLAAVEVTENTPLLSIPWKMTFPLSVTELKMTDPIAQIINFVDNAVDVQVHQDCISTVLSELYNNSVDYGLLKLDSSIKGSDDGFIEYYLERKKSLDTLSEGNITVTLDYKIDNSKNCGLLQIIVSDSGPGFDFQSVLSSCSAFKSAYSYGRGLGLVDSLCDHLQYQNDGRTAIAGYSINRQNLSIKL